MQAKRTLLFEVGIISLCLGLLLLLTFPVRTKTKVIINENLRTMDYAGNVYAYRNQELVYQGHNNMTDLGPTAVNQQLFDAGYTSAVWNYIAIGTGDGTATNKSRTALVTELDRKLATFYVPATGQFGLNYTFTFAGSSTIKEAGVFNASSSGHMLFYIWTLSIAVTSSDTLLICWKGTTTGS